MLLRLMIYRVGPFALLGRCKDQKSRKCCIMIIGVIYGVSFLGALQTLYVRYTWRMFLLLPAAMFPQFVFYVFSLWMTIRCAWKVWSERVWRRIYGLSLVSVMLGVLCEKYINPMILQKIYIFFN